MKSTNMVLSGVIYTAHHLSSIHCSPLVSGVIDTPEPPSTGQQCHPPLVTVSLTPQPLVSRVIDTAQ
jgi:hypothetical protein